MKLRVLTFLLAVGSAYSQCASCASQNQNSGKCQTASNCHVSNGLGSCSWYQSGNTKTCSFVPAPPPPPPPPPASPPSGSSGGTSGSSPAPPLVSAETCQMRLVKTQIQYSRAYDFSFEEIEVCANSANCDIWENVPGADAANLTTFSGLCEQETSCATNGNGNGGGNGGGPKTTGTDRVTICHRTCSSKNPWVRITIDADAWNDTQCEGHNNHEVLYKRDGSGPAECSTKINHLASSEGSTPESIRNKYWGPNDHDYMIKWHGNKQAKDFPSKTAEKAYWKEWEPACPYVNSDKCCDWQTGNCCGGYGGTDGGSPPPAPEIPLPVPHSIAIIKYACSKNVNSCSDSDVTAALSSGECEIDMYTGYSGDAARYCYRITNTGGSTLCDMELTDDTAVASGNPNGVILPGTTDCLTSGQTIMWPGYLPSTIPQPQVTEEGRVVVTAKPQGSTSEDPYIWADDYAGLEGVLASIEIKKYACSITSGSAANFNCKNRISSSSCVDEILYGVMDSPAVYCYKVTNPSDVTLCEVTVTDADGLNDQVTSVGMNQGCVKAGDVVYPQAFSLPTITDEEYNDAVVIGYPYSDDGSTKIVNEYVTAKDPAGVEPSSPAITIKKYACGVTSGNEAAFDCESGLDSCVDDILYAPSGTTAVYCFKVTNPSDTTLCEVSMVDNDGFTRVVTGSSPKEGCILPLDSVFTEANPLPTIQVKEVGNATVTGVPYSDDGSSPTGGVPVTDIDPAGVDPSSPQISITKYACSDSNGDGSNFNCEAGVADKSCVLDILRAPSNSAAVYCFHVSNPSDTTLCEVLVTDTNDGFTAVPTGTNPMPTGCMKPGDSVFTTPKTLTVTAYEDVPATVVGTPYNDEATNPTGGQPVTATDPAGVDPAGKSPVIDIIKYACSDPSSLGSNYNCKDNIPTDSCVDEILYAPLGTNAVYCFEVSNPSDDTTLCEVAVQDSTFEVGAGSSDMPANCLKPKDTVYPQAHPLPQIIAFENYPATVTGIQYNDAGTFATGGEVSHDDLAGVDPAAQNPVIQIKKYACSDPSSLGSNYNCKDNIPTESCVDEILYAPMTSNAVYCFEVTNPSDDTTLCRVTVKDGTYEVGTGSSDMPGNCLKPKDVVFPEAHPLPQVTGYENYNATVTGIQYNDAGTVATGGEVSDYDPAGVDPAGKTPVIEIKKYACSDPGNVGSTYSCQNNIATDLCVDDILSLPMSSNAVYCFKVTNPSTDTTLCEVALKDGTFEVGVGSLNMPTNCLKPQSIIYPEAHPVPQVAAFENYNATVTGIQYNDAGTVATGNEVSDNDPAGLDPIEPSCPTEMGLTGSRANEELGESCSEKAVYLENMIPPVIDLSNVQLGSLVDLFYTIESTTPDRISFRVQNPFSSNYDMYVRYHKPVGTGHAMEKGCLMEPDVSDCAFRDDPIEAYCLDPFNVDGNDQVKPYTVVDLYFVTIGQNFASSTDAKVDECCLEEGQVQPALTEDVMHLTFVLDCFCPTLYQPTVARSLLRGGEHYRR